MLELKIKGANIQIGDTLKLEKKKHIKVSEIRKRTKKRIFIKVEDLKQNRQLNRFEFYNIIMPKGELQNQNRPIYAG